MGDDVELDDGETRGIEDVGVELIADEIFGEETAAVGLLVCDTASDVGVVTFVCWAMGRAVGDVTSNAASDANAVSPADRVTVPKAGSESVNGKSTPADCQRV